jgi:hypothetical protein
VQSGAFDRFCFNDVECYIKDDIEPYRETVDFIVDRLKIPDIHDHFLGMAAGTIGQAHGFLMCIPGKTEEERNFHFEFAEVQILEDLGHFEEGSKDWSQGNNYLITLYWQKKQIEKACARHFWNIKKANADLKSLLFRFDDDIKKSIQNSDGDWDSFIICNHLRLGALALDLCPDKTIYSRAIIDLLGKLKSGYPSNIAAKWAAYILSKIGTQEDGIRLLEKNGIVNAHHPVLNLMDVINKAFLSKLTGNISDSETDILRNQLTSIMGQGDGYKTYLKEKAWAKNILNRNILSCDIDDLVMGLPYYYA